MAVSQQGIPRPRRKEADPALREAILQTLAQLQGTGSLSALADDLLVSVKTLSRYRNPGNGKPKTLGGDVLFRICELCDERNVSIPCNGRILRLPKEDPSLPSAASPPQQLQFKFTGSIDIDVPTRKCVMRVHSIVTDDYLKTG